MVSAATAQIQQEAALGDFAAEKRVARLQLEKMRRQATMWNQLDEELKCVFVRRGNNGVGALGSNAVALDAESGVLSGTEFERSAGNNVQDAQIMSNITENESPRTGAVVTETNQHDGT